MCCSAHASRKFMNEVGEKKLAESYLFRRLAQLSIYQWTRLTEWTMKKGIPSVCQSVLKSSDPVSLLMPLSEVFSLAITIYYDDRVLSVTKVTVFIFQISLL